MYLGWKTFQGINATKSLSCVMGTKGMYIQIFFVTIGRARITRYQQLQNLRAAKKDLIKNYSENIKYSIYHLQNMSYQQLSPEYTAVPKLFLHPISIIYQIYHTSTRAPIQKLKVVQQCTQHVLLLLSWIKMIKNRPLWTIIDLLLQ